MDNTLFKTLVNRALLHLKNNKDINLTFVKDFSFANGYSNETHVAVLNDPHIAAFFETDNLTSRAFNAFPKEAKETSSQFAIHFNTTLDMFDDGSDLRKTFTVNVETKLPFFSIIMQNIIPAGGSHYESLSLKEPFSGAELQHETRLVLRIAYAIWQAYKIWNKQINEVVADLTNFHN